MNTDASIRASILACGVPVSALSKTLPNIGQAALREHIVSREWEKKHEARSLFIYPANLKTRTHAARVFHVLAKEFVLIGADVHLTSLTRLVRNVLGEDDEADEDLAYRVNSAEVILISGFYDMAFKKNPHNDEQVFEFYDWLTNSWTAGKVVYFLADAMVQRCTSWWDATFLAEIEEHVSPYEIAETK